MVWVCEHHGKKCKSYVISIADELNNAGIEERGLKEYVKQKPSFEKFAKLVKWERD